MATETTTVGERAFKDRKTGLVLFGIVEILIGLFFILAIGSLVLRPGCRSCSTPSATNPSCATSSPDIKMMAPAAVFAGLGAIWFFTMGAGSIRCRRWARSLMLLFAWFWLLSGLISMLFVATIAWPSMQSRTPSGGGSPMPAAFFVSIAVTFLVYVVLPLAFVWFYNSKDVKATVEYRDPQVRWTDRCPLPVLAVSLLAGWFVLIVLVSLIFAWFGIGATAVFPLFGRLLTGTVAGGVQVSLMVVAAYVAWGAYKLDIRAWWCAVILAILAIASAVGNALCLDPMQIYDKMHLSAAQMEAIRKCGMAGGRWTYGMSGLWPLAGLGYLLWIRQFFCRGPRMDDVNSPQN
ncbi:MAG: hypothetical protein ABFC54_02275 [Thermoguttaceae bacterium]